MKPEWLLVFEQCWYRLIRAWQDGMSDIRQGHLFIMRLCGELPEKVEGAFCFSLETTHSGATHS